MNNRIIFKNAAIIDAVSDEPLHNHEIVVENGIIKSIAPLGQTLYLEQDEIIDLTGRYLMPGLIDAHVHLELAGHFVMEETYIKPSVGLVALNSYTNALTTLKHGFTTIRDAGSFFKTNNDVRDAINMKLLPGPRILSTGHFLGTTNGHFDSFLPKNMLRSDYDTRKDWVCDSPEDFKKAVRKLSKDGVDWIKIAGTGGIKYPDNVQELDDEELKMVVKTASSRGLNVMAHCMYEKGTMAAIKAGVKTIEHCTYITEDMIEPIKENNTWLVPTLSVARAVIESLEAFNYSQSDVYVKMIKNVYENTIKSFELAMKHDLPIASGSDVGYVIHKHGANAKELYELTRHGMSSIKAIKTATIKTAQMLGMEDKIGSIQEGKIADIIVLMENPLQDIKVLQDEKKIQLVMKEGAIFKNYLGNQY